jgi:hypothetical protein
MVWSNKLMNTVGLAACSDRKLRMGYVLSLFMESGTMRLLVLNPLERNGGHPVNQA